MAAVAQGVGPRAFGREVSRLVVVDQDRRVDGSVRTDHAEDAAAWELTSKRLGQLEGRLRNIESDLGSCRAELDHMKRQVDIMAGAARAGWSFNARRLASEGRRLWADVWATSWEAPQ